jgi:predicted transcriptional regulator
MTDTTPKQYKEQSPVSTEKFEKTSENEAQRKGVDPKEITLGEIISWVDVMKNLWVPLAAIIGGAYYLITQLATATELEILQCDIEYQKHQSVQESMTAMLERSIDNNIMEIEDLRRMESLINNILSKQLLATKELKNKTEATHHELIDSMRLQEQSRLESLAQQIKSNIANYKKRNSNIEEELSQSKGSEEEKKDKHIACVEKYS